jgi:hydroxyacylglutathione hydrolase
MFIRQLYTGCISEAAYYIESDGIAAIVDPMRDIEEYLNWQGTQRNDQIHI